MTTYPVFATSNNEDNQLEEETPQETPPEEGEGGEFEEDPSSDEGQGEEAEKIRRSFDSH